MKYEELEKKMMEEINATIENNKKLYSDGVKGAENYDTELMKDISDWNNTSSLQSSDNFNEVLETIDRMKNKIADHQVCKYGDADLETEDRDYASFTYRLYIYEPIDSLSDLEDYQKHQVLRNKMAGILKVPDYRYVKCEIVKLYKEDIITLEQLKEAHHGKC